MISICRGDEELVKIPINFGSKAKKELMTEDNITLVFSSDKLYKFKTGDYVNDSNLGYYILTSDYYPTHNQSAGGYNYSIKFDAYYYAWNNYFVKLNPTTTPELSFSYTRSISDHVGIILENIYSIGFKYQSSEFSVEISSNITKESKNIVYDNIHIIDAITQIAETFECEWWVEDNCLHFGKCEYAGNFDFEIGKSVSSMTPSDSSEDVGTRLYVFGSEKNLPTDYRKSLDSEKYAIVQKRLMLPEGVPYIEKTGTSKSQIKEFVKVFDIFPKVDSSISRVERDVFEIENDDKTVTTERRYYFTDDSFVFSKEYLTTEDLTIRFKTGSLAGMDFTLEFLENGFPKVGIETQAFKINPNENYGRLLPDEDLFPKAGDEYYLLNWDSSKITELGLVKKAEEELLTAGQNYLKELDTDGKTFTCSMRPHVAEQMYQGNIKSLLNLGDGVTLINNVYFPDNPRKSRIIGYEYNLDYPCDNPVYTAGNKPKYSRLKTLEENVDSLVYSGETEKNFGTGSVHVLSRRDETPASDRNVFSSLRSQIEFLSKKKEDTAQEMITFEKGLYSKMMSFFDSISSKKYVSGFTGEGFLLEMKDGISKLEIDELTVRKIMTIFELIIQKIRAVGGQIVVSAADGKIKEVKDNGESYFITFEGDNLFVENDQMRFQTFTGSNLKSYWVEIVKSTTEGITVLKSEFNGVTPMPGDECVLMGNTQNARRQNLILISATEEKPCIDILEGVHSKNLDNCLRARLGNLDGIYDELFGENQPKGDGLYSDNAYLKGEFIVKNTGQSVETMFAVQDGKIKSSVTSLQNDATKERNFLQNGSFTDGLKCWVTSNDDKLLMSNDDFIFDNESALYESVSVSSEPLYDNIHYATINRGWIRQAHYNFVDMPEFDSDKEYPLTIKFNIRCRQNSYVQVSIGNVIKYMAFLPQTEDFVTYTIEKIWDGMGDFKITTLGVIDIYGISIYTEATEAKYRTFFDQSEKLIKFGAEKIDDDGNTLNGSEVKVTDEGTFLNVVYQDENNERQEATLGEFKTETDESGNTTTKIKLSGDNIQLEGDVTANGKVNIRPDGTLKAFNGVFTGVIRNGIVVITKENFYTYFKKVVVTEPVENTYFTPVDNNFYSKMKIKSIPDDITYFHIFLPTYNYYDDDVWGDLGYARIDLDSAREFIGTSFYLYNEIEETGDKQQYIDVYRMRPPVEGESNWVLTGTDVNSKGFTAYEYKLFIGEEDTYGVDEAMYWEQIVKFGNMLTD